ncbi:uncharacterized protein CLUP02_13551 [Colletotrichum lupini]|uniref:Uncharacterized protein n=1 Tax=Colletotrichum lupini TaxID=145971 RepID=A0A9Q8WLS4_9PEZI|nr:uncharacterized protein CLUP02_13551 [Colletotrichum lupini]KAK1702928.1 hypothetical protein BDP67DRAFT_536927 [Colletotrichum lupini]UQC88029.1 hypothetical protein CLUP02_13551 [Colletotrichum lupini]
MYLMKCRAGTLSFLRLNLFSATSTQGLELEKRINYPSAFTLCVWLRILSSQHKSSGSSGWAMLDCSTQFRLQKANQGPVSISREGQSRLSEISTQQTTPIAQYVPHICPPPLSTLDQFHCPKAGQHEGS